LDEFVQTNYDRSKNFFFFLSLAGGEH